MTKKEISRLYADEQVVRLIAAHVVVVTVLSLFSERIYPMAFLAADFALRTFTLLPSPLAAIGKILARVLNLKPKPIFAAPKKFAAGLGFVFSLSVFILFVLKLYTAAYIVGGILILCAILESVFIICLGCYVYNWVVVPVVNRKNN